MSLFSKVFGGASAPEANRITDPSERDPEAGLAQWFVGDHHDCDARWVRVEAAVDDGDVPVALEAFASFNKAMKRHFSWEEQVLFPAFEQATGMVQGPTQVMRMEHEQMRGVLRTMEDAALDEDLDALVEHGDTLLMFIQQHNQKEEGMLYPMADRAVGPQWPALHQALSRLA